MKTSKRKVTAVAGSILISLLVVGAVIFGSSFFRSEDYAFTQLMGDIEKTDTQARVRWTYIRNRASPMRLTVERPDVWSVSGLWHGKPAHLVIRFSDGRVEGTSLDFLPLEKGAAARG